MADPLDSVPGAELVVEAGEVDAAFGRMAEFVQPLVDSGDCVLLGVLLGGMFPLVRLTSLLRGDFTVDYCHATRYRGEVSGGELDWIRAPSADLDGRTVIIVDDIFDEGLTLDAIAGYCRRCNAAAVSNVVLIRKRHDRQRVPLEPDFAGIEVDDRYVFGCGMDYRNRWRHLPAVYALPPADGS